MRYKKEKKNWGFTLIEMMVVLTILSILIVVISIKQRDNIRRKKVEMDSLLVKQMIEFTRDYALSGETLDSGDVPDEFRFRIQGNRYWIDAWSDVHSAIIESDVNHLESELDSEVQVAGGGTATISYGVPYAELLEGGSVTLCHKDDCNDPNFRYTIEVTDNSIEMEHLKKLP